MRAVAFAGLVFLGTSCALAQTTPGAEAPLHIGPVTQFESRALSESSGIAVSRQHPGLLWTHNDGGHGAFVYATDTLARDRGTFQVVGARNRDWEDMAIGPCPSGGECLYLGDVGDNRRARSSATIYRFPEPGQPGIGADSVGVVVDVDRLTFTYPESAEDVEAMYVDPSGHVYLITKPGDDDIRHYRLPNEAWGRDEVAVAELVGRFPIEPGTTRLAGVTGADLSADGSHLVVRTYRELFFYLTDPGGGGVSGPVTTCPILGLESQGEGVAWLDDDRVVLTSERGVFGRGTVAVVRCRLPWRDGRDGE